MAVVCLRCKMWVIFLYIFAIPTVFSETEYHHYITDIADDYPVEHLKNDVLHRLEKREISGVESGLLLPSTTPKPTNESLSQTPPLASNQRPVYESADAGTTVTLRPNSTQLLNRNLGVNGTGQRKDVNWNTLNKTLEVATVLNITQPLPDNKTSIVNASSTASPIEGHEDDIAISHSSDDIVNRTAQDSSLKTEYDNHEYYKSTFTVDPTAAHRYWVDFTNVSGVRTNELLSQSHRRAATVKLNFDFPFYGHIVRNVTIATGGFLYTGEYVHSWLAATQYIAPLMANFDTSLSNDSYIRYVDNGTAFTVQWERVCLQDKPNGGEFTFQATLHANGDIVFVYQHVPIYIDSIDDDHHPVKVGLSDAYIIDRTIFFVRRKTIYEYHRVNFNHEDIKNWTVIYLSALPTCLVNKDCTSCLSKNTSNFDCTWCPSSGRCSNGMDRHRQDWIVKGCERKQLRNESQCALAGDGGDTVVSEGGAPGTGSHYDLTDHDGALDRDLIDDPKQASRITNEVNPRHAEKGVSVGISGVVSILFVVGILAGLSMWVLYAYRNPHSASGQMLIRYRPSQWSWRRGEARYTAATIHM